MNKKLVTTFLIFVLSFVGSGLINLYTPKPPVKVSKQDSALNFDDSFINLFSLGQKRLLTSLLWITTLLESDAEHYKKRDLNSWLFLRFKSIATLDPLFLSNYQLGGVYLSIIKDDLEGADYIFQKGLKYYPDDYKLLYNASFLYAVDKNDYKKAELVLNKLIQRHNPPAFFKSLYIKVKSKTSINLQETLDLLLDLYRETNDDYLKQRLKKEIYFTKAKIDLECLNANKLKCDKLDFYGRPYQYINNKYLPNEKIDEIKIFKPSNQ